LIGDEPGASVLLMCVWTLGPLIFDGIGMAGSNGQ